MPFKLPTLLSFKGSTHLLDVGSFSNLVVNLVAYLKRFLGWFWFSVGAKRHKKNLKAYK